MERWAHVLTKNHADGGRSTHLHAESTFGEVAEEGKRRQVEYVLVVATVVEKERDLFWSRIFFFFFSVTVRR